MSSKLKFFSTPILPILIAFSVISKISSSLMPRLRNEIGAFQTLYANILNRLSTKTCAERNNRLGRGKITKLFALMLKSAVVVLYDIF